MRSFAHPGRRATSTVARRAYRFLTPILRRFPPRIPFYVIVVPPPPRTPTGRACRVARAPRGQGTQNARDVKHRTQQGNPVMRNLSVELLERRAYFAVTASFNPSAFFFNDTATSEIYTIT